MTGGHLHRVAGRRTALAATALAAVLFGTAGVARALGPDGLTSPFAGSWRVVGGGATLVVLAAADRQRASAVRPSREQGLDPQRRLGWVAAGALAVTGYQLAFFAATERVGVAGAAVAATGTGPVVAGLLDRVVSARPVRPRWAIGVAVAVIGIVALSTTNATGGPATGWLFAVTAGCCYPTYGLAAQQLMRDRSALSAIATVFGVAAVVTLPMAVLATRNVFSPTGADVPAGPTVAVAVYLGVVATGAAYALWARGLQRLSLSDTVALTLAEPAAAVALAALLLDERIDAPALAGMATVLIGVVVATAAPRAGRPTPDR